MRVAAVVECRSIDPTDALFRAVEILTDDSELRVGFRSLCFLNTIFDMAFWHLEMLGLGS